MNIAVVLLILVVLLAFFQKGRAVLSLPFWAFGTLALVITYGSFWVADNIARR